MELEFRVWHIKRQEYFKVLVLHLSNYNGRRQHVECTNGYITIWPNIDEVCLEQRGTNGSWIKVEM